MNKQVVYLTISFIFGNIVGYLCFNNFNIAIAFSIIIILIMFFTLDIKNFMLWIGFFFVGIASFYMFFNIKFNNESIELRVKDVNGFYVKSSYKGRNFIMKDYTKKIVPGDRITIKGTLKRDTNYSTGVIGSFENYKILSSRRDFISKIYDLRIKIKDKFQNELGESRGAIVTGVCFGDLRGATEEQKEEFKQLGIIHSVSVSGFHLNLIYSFLEGILGTSFGILITGIYVVFTGAKASSLRAFIMIIFLRLSTKVYKTYRPLPILTFTALVLGFYRPYYIFNAGFHLSFLSTLGIILYNKKLDKILYKIPNCIRSTVALTFSSQIFTFPYIIIAFNYFSFGFLLGNLLIMPFISILVILGNVGLIFSNFDFIFNIIVKIIYFILVIMENISDVLKIISPKISFMDYKYSVIYCLIIMSFYLYSKGYKSLKFFPVAVILSGSLWIYNTFPTINFYKVDNCYIYDIGYKWERVVLTKGDMKDFYTKEKLKYCNIIEEDDNKYKVNLNKKYDIILNNENLYLYSKGCFENKISLKDGVTVKILPNRILSIGEEERNEFR
ncbi:ComEC/Rec2 family competence protein [Clostridium frigidicarnis]|uniref:Competence protein ComEC n=1 Tax=Clostridium frigidicarnis TaxID=84698 RepID=A0A1I0VH79_9CLOT|nr:ComEC/Rec2 family competence protein [Clostridium frigidicarnis]SFA75383.1 competence protein ComEC [Clostridium frigidicarnis]